MLQVQGKVFTAGYCSHVRMSIDPGLCNTGYMEQYAGYMSSLEHRARLLFLNVL